MKRKLFDVLTTMYWVKVKLLVKSYVMGLQTILVVEMDVVEVVRHEILVGNHVTIVLVVKKVVKIFYGQHQLKQFNVLCWILSQIFLV